jgi:hypothetical protein
MFFLSQPSTLLKLHSHPRQYQLLCIKHLSIRDIRAPLQLAHKPIRGMPMRRVGLRAMVLITQYVNIVVYLISIP